MFYRLFKSYKKLFILSLVLILLVQQFVFFSRFSEWSSKILHFFNEPSLDSQQQLFNQSSILQIVELPKNYSKDGGVFLSWKKQLIYPIYDWKIDDSIEEMSSNENQTT